MRDLAIAQFEQFDLVGQLEKLIQSVNSGIAAFASGVLMELRKDEEEEDI
jgi:hypothetical protein